MDVCLRFFAIWLPVASYIMQETDRTKRERYQICWGIALIVFFIMLCMEHETWLGDLSGLSNLINDRTYDLSFVIRVVNHSKSNWYYPKEDKALMNDLLQQAIECSSLKAYDPCLKLQEALKQVLKHLVGHKNT